MAKKSRSRPQAIRERAAQTATALGSASPVAEATKRRTSARQFAKEVRAEARKITWTSWKETWITSLMVAIMVALSAVFFWVVDLGLGAAITQLLKLATSG